LKTVGQSWEIFWKSGLFPNLKLKTPTSIIDRKSPQGFQEQDAKERLVVGWNIFLIHLVGTISLALQTYPGLGSCLSPSECLSEAVPN
jgi:hypothetical protein